MLVIRTEGRLYFANAPRIREAVWEHIQDTHPDVVLLDCSAIVDIEFTALRTMMDFEDQLNDDGIVLWLAGLNPDPLHIVRNSPLIDTLGDQRMFHNVEQAVESFLDKQEAHST